jgi:hypothetical protein
MSGEADARCPFLVPVVADLLWLHPVSAYCRRPDVRVRVPAPATLARTCTMPGYVRCPGYRQALTGSEDERHPVSVVRGAQSPAR